MEKKDGSTKGSPPSVCAVLLVWRDHAIAGEAFQALLDVDYENFSILVVQNEAAKGKEGQHPAPPSFLQDRTIDATTGKNTSGALCREVDIGERSCRLLQFVENLGYTGAHNAALRHLLEDDRQHDYVLLLNDDAIVEPGAVTELVRVAEMSGAAITGATIWRPDTDRAQFAGEPPADLQNFLFSPLLSTRGYDPKRMERVEPSGRANGAATLLAVDALHLIQEETGRFLDDRLFLYYDEHELSARARRLGLDTVVARDARVKHLEAVSAGGMFNPISYYYMTRNRLLLAPEFSSSSRLLLFYLFYPLATAGRILRNLLAGRFASARAILRGLVDGWRGRTGKWDNHDDVAN